jgi:hypothetical protein
MGDDEQLLGRRVYDTITWACGRSGTTSYWGWGRV